MKIVGVRTDQPSFSMTANVIHTIGANGMTSWGYVLGVFSFPVAWFSG